MAYPRFIVLVLAALALAGCCASSTGCYVAIPGVPTAWDGDGARPDDDEAALRKKSVKRPKSAMGIAGSQVGARAGALADARGEVVPPTDVFAAKDAADRDADARLMRKLMICRGCLPPAADEDIGSVARR
jgi:hypothetical protein